jgi:hypothetical protein
MPSLRMCGYFPPLPYTPCCGYQTGEVFNIVYVMQIYSWYFKTCKNRFGGFWNPPLNLMLYHKNNFVQDLFESVVVLLGLIVILFGVSYLYIDIY